MKEEYAITDKEGNFLTAPNETGSGKFIALTSKENATLEVEKYYKGKGYKVKKLKVHPN